jgi:hypothetical protein
VLEGCVVDSCGFALPVSRLLWEEIEKINQLNKNWPELAQTRL